MEQEGDRVETPDREKKPRETPSLMKRRHSGIGGLEQPQIAQVGDVKGTPTFRNEY